MGGFPHGKMKGPFMQLPSKTTSISMLNAWDFFAEHLFIGLADQGKDIVLRFIREYSSLRILAPR